MDTAAELDPWQAVGLPPADAAVGEQIDFALRCAILAPSSHNSQPWRFRLDGTAIELLADRSRALEVIDPEHRELVISCGAALFHLRVALRAVGRAPLVERIPRDGDRDLLARVEPDAFAESTEEHRALVASIPRRRTNRLPFQARPLPKQLGQQLKRAAAAEGAELVLVSAPNTKRAVADLIAEGDRRQWSDRRFRSELAAWTRPNHSSRRDGIPGYGLGRRDASSVILPIVVKALDLGEGQAARDHRLAEESAALGVLLTERDGPLDWLRGGEALGRVLLRAQIDGISASFVNQPIEEAALRPALGEALGESGFPQVVLRLGYADEPARPTPRRRLEEVLL